MVRPASSAARLGVGRKGRAKFANRDRLNALAAVEKKQDAEAAALQRRAHRQHFAAARAQRERHARASPAESTQCYHVEAPSSGSVGQEPRFDRNNASVAPELLAANPQAAEECREFLTCLRRYLRHKPAGLGTYGLVVETLTLCAQGRIASVQMLTSLRNILCKHPQVLRALTSLLTRVHAATNSSASPAAMTPQNLIQQDADILEHAAALLTLDSSRSEGHGLAALPQAVASQQPAVSHDGSASSEVAAEAPCHYGHATPAHLASMCLLQAAQTGVQWHTAQHGAEAARHLRRAQ